MSSATVGKRAEFISPMRPAESRAFKLLSALLALSTIGAITLGLVSTSVPKFGWVPLTWVVLVACASFVSVPTGGGASLSMDLPVLLGAAAVYDPALCGLIAMLAATDPREWRRSISGWLAIYNRSQVALSVMVASLVFHGVGGKVGVWPWAAVAAILALSADCAVNYSLVALAVSLRQGRTFRGALASLRFGDARVFVPTYLSFGFLGALLAETYASVGLLGVVAFVAPILLARQMFVHWRLIERFAKSLSLRTKALEDVDQRILEERRDERLVLAGGIHDEVLPPLFKVHLMGEVLRRDLEAGRLLDLDDDLPQLLDATNRAQEPIRKVLRNLRSTQIGPDGLNATLRLLVQSVEKETDAAIHVKLDQVRGSSITQLLIYQITREVLHNAVKHSNAREIEVALTADQDVIRLVVRDDGVGFDPMLVDHEAHFGLQLLAERVDAARGVLYVNSEPGSGTTVVATLPTDDED
jgi:signal transduction histidine kinase